MPYSNPTESKGFRQQLRKEATPCERILWHYLRGRQLEGLKFRRQHGYGPYVMDFYCPVLQWCIEVDGEVHDTAIQKEKDDDRTCFLEQHGITVTRIRNEAIEENTGKVMEMLRQEALMIAGKRKLKLPLARGSRCKKAEILQEDRVET